ncbi:hypothetical protein [Teredinibacter sp. KSP-S5-2]|uniref:hypothetical protein n=1 Tax=Teredinibacter sp. KSP-S5-2 TaxID=3034506 RepID=UPI0029349C10|nr:hypothetical protein [Teredinibacter sp. KSP-S5-2]WNO09055.1 hypothetical protein P5V12_19100 [Teredinibacter sp. KSP-S5-2]
MSISKPAHLGSGILILSSLVISTGAHAQVPVGQGNPTETDASIGFSLEWLDNANVNQPESVDELQRTVNFGFIHSYDSNWLAFSTDALFNYVDYENDTLEDNSDVTGNLNLDLFLMPKRLTWLTSYNREEAITTPLLAENDDTNISRGIFETGPELFLGLGETNVVLSASYVQVDSDQNEPRQLVDGEDEPLTPQTDGTSKRYNYSAFFRRSISPLTQVFLGGTYSDVYEVGTFDTGVDRDLTFDSENFQIGVTRILKYGEASFSYGINSIERASGSKTEGTFLGANAFIITPEGNFTFAATKALTDSSLGLSISTGFTGNLSNGDTNFTSSDVVERERLEVQFDRDIFDGNGSFNMGISFDREDFETDLRDSDRTGADIGIEYALSEVWSTDLDLSYQKTEFIDQVEFGIDHTYEVTLGTSYEFSSNLVGDIAVSYAKRKNDDEIAVGDAPVQQRDYDQTTISLSVRYRLF